MSKSLLSWQAPNATLISAARGCEARMAKISEQNSPLLFLAALDVRVRYSSSQEPCDNGKKRGPIMNVSKPCDSRNIVTDLRSYHSKPSRFFATYMRRGENSKYRKLTKKF